MPTELIRLSPAFQQRYRVDRELGRGGMGAVYLATDLRLDRLVALKVLPTEFASDVSLRERFLRETRTAASFSHPNIVPVHSVEEDAGSLAFVMGFVEGESLTARVARTGPLDVRSLVRMLQDVAYALAYAHGRGVVHRDIKPDNIMIERATGRALVMDFGISRAITPTAAAPGLTRVGEIVGTPEYMSPEQASGDNVDGRSDLYSLGLVAHFAITGRRPITGETAQQIIVKQLTETLPPAASLRPDLPPALADAIDRCVAKEPGDRFATAEALVEAIDNANLTAPEIPIAIRMFAQEAGTLGLIIAFVSAISTVMVILLSGLTSGIDSLLPVVLLYGVAFTRAMQSRAEAARLAAMGFTVANMLDGMRAVLDERLSVRAVLQADPDERRRRKRSLIRAAVQIPVAIVLVKWALSQRVQIAPHHYQTGPLPTAAVLAAILLFASSFVLALRSPIRAPIGERLFRIVWLGPIGRAFLRSAMRRRGAPAGAMVSRSGGHRVYTPPPARSTAIDAAPPAPASPTAPSAATPTPTDLALLRIEERLAAIEQAVTPRPK